MTMRGERRTDLIYMNSHLSPPTRERAESRSNLYEYSPPRPLWGRAAGVWGLVKIKISVSVRTWGSPD
jgi:hypothetical protein